MFGRSQENNRSTVFCGLCLGIRNLKGFGLNNPKESIQSEARSLPACRVTELSKFNCVAFSDLGVLRDQICYCIPSFSM